MTVQKWVTLAIYILMLGAIVALPGSTTAQVIAWVFVALAVIHILEFVVMLKVMQVAGGSMINHFLQTLLFGFMHWQPLKQKSQ